MYKLSSSLNLFSCDTPLTCLDLLLLTILSPLISCDTIYFWWNKFGGGKKIHSVFDALFPRPMCISSPNLTKWLWISDRPNSSWRRFSKGKAQSSTYKTQYRVSKFPSEKFLPCVLPACLCLAASDRFVATLSCSNLLLSIIFQVSQQRPSPWRVIKWGPYSLLVLHRLSDSLSP